MQQRSWNRSHYDRLFCHWNRQIRCRRRTWIRNAENSWKLKFALPMQRLRLETSGWIESGRWWRIAGMAARSAAKLWPEFCRRAFPAHPENRSSGSAILWLDAGFERNAELSPAEFARLLQHNVFWAQSSVWFRFALHLPRLYEMCDCFAKVQRWTGQTNHSHRTRHW